MGPRQFSPDIHSLVSDSAESALVVCDLTFHSEWIIKLRVRIPKVKLNNHYI